jgi:hypothetical protein
MCYIHGHTRDEDSYRDIFVTYGYIQHCHDSRLTVNPITAAEAVSSTWLELVLALTLDSEVGWKRESCGLCVFLHVPVLRYRAPISRGYPKVYRWLSHSLHTLGSVGDNRGWRCISATTELLDAKKR